MLLNTNYCTLITQPNIGDYNEIDGLDDCDGLDAGMDAGMDDGLDGDGLDAGMDNGLNGDGLDAGMDDGWNDCLDDMDDSPDYSWDYAENDGNNDNTNYGVDNGNDDSEGADADDDSAIIDELGSSSIGTNNNSDSKKKRRSYSREFKISVLTWHRKNGFVKNKTARHFDLSHQNVLRWVRSEAEILNGKKGAKSQGSGRRAMYPLLEHELHKEFVELRKKGMKIRNIWFITR